MRLGDATQLCPLMTSIFSKAINLEQAKHASMMYLQDSSSVTSGGSARSVADQAEQHSSEPSVVEGEPGSDSKWRPTRLPAEATSFSSHLTSMARTSAAILTEVSPLRFVAGALECGAASGTV